MTQDHNLGAKFHRRTVSQPQISREFRIGNIDRGDKDSVTGFVVIPLVIFFPGLTMTQVCQSVSSGRVARAFPGGRFAHRED